MTRKRKTDAKKAQKRNIRELENLERLKEKQLANSEGGFDPSQVSSADSALSRKLASK
ncbi:MAG: hypothetical protein KC777_25290 [Cyanobacteria bacterium HKST-UBA02]|nr:hypothetical protein [Cyanobacteria bacterium HKST-UBA02]